jgi:hypothetical protein
VWDRDSSVDIGTAYGLNGEVRFLAEVRDDLFSTTFRGVLGPTQLYIKCAPRVLSRGAKQQKREADHSLPSSVEVKNGGAIFQLLATS